MTKKTMYFPPEMDTLTRGVQFELRAQLAFELLKAHSMVTGTPGEYEDSSGRNVAENMSPEATVDRAITMAEIFVEKCEVRDYIKPTQLSLPDAAKAAGILQRLRSGYDNKELMDYDLEGSVLDALLPQLGYPEEAESK